MFGWHGARGGPRRGWLPKISATYSVLSAGSWLGYDPHLRGVVDKSGLVLCSCAREKLRPAGRGIVQSLGGWRRYERVWKEYNERLERGMKMQRDGWVRRFCWRRRALQARSYSQSLSLSSTCWFASRLLARRRYLHTVGCVVCKDT